MPSQEFAGLTRNHATGGEKCQAQILPEQLFPAGYPTMLSNRTGGVCKLLLAAVSLLAMVSPTRAQTHSIIKSFGVATNVMGFNPRSELVQGDDGSLYGTTSSGDGNGTVFKVNTNGTGYTVLKWFNNPADGATPYAGLAFSGNTLYGTTYSGGISNYGTVFKLNTDGTGYVVLKHFVFSDGAHPYARLTLLGDTLYGTAYFGGTSNYGTVFTLKTDGADFAVLKHFDWVDGANPSGGLVLSNNTLYGTTYYGGSSGLGFGTVFKLNTDGSGSTVLKRFGSFNDGHNPYAGLILSDGTLYGTTYYGGIGDDKGTVYKLNTDGTGYSVLAGFGGFGGWYPYGGLALSGSTLYGTTSTDGNSSYGTVFRVNTDGTGYAVLKQFGGSEARFPYAGLILSGSTLYGTTFNGGSSGYGTVFKLNTDGTGFSMLTQFTSSDTANPDAAVTVSGNTLFGTTLNGGRGGKGTVFKVNTDDTGYTVLKWFTNSTEGANPSAGLTLSSNMLYGTTSKGGTVPSGGTVFKLNTNGTGFTVLRSLGGGLFGGVTLSGSTLYGTTYRGGNSSMGTVFKLNTDGTGYAGVKDFIGSDGAYPDSDLILSGSTLYGTTSQGGTVGRGTVFKVNTNGTGFVVLKHFSQSDGFLPNGLVLSGSTLYGTTAAGGSPSLGMVFKVSTNGTGFAILKWFNSFTNGANPGAGLTLSGSTLYGTTYNGGNGSEGTVFSLNTDGTGYTVLKHFAGGDGASPFAGLALSAGRLYGTTRDGGEYGLGTVFSLGLPPRFAGVTQDGNGAMNLSLVSEPGRRCDLYASTNLSDWELLATLTNQTGTLLYTDDQSTNLPARFYRAVQLP